MKMVPRFGKIFNFPPFVVNISDLIELSDLQDIENKSFINDPLNAVPPLPFGHLNHKWEAFKNKIQLGDEVWSFSSVYEYRSSFRERRNGFAILRGQQVMAYFLTEIKPRTDQ